MSSQPSELLGQRFGRLVVVAQAPDRLTGNGAGRGPRAEKMLVVRCDCGSRKTVFYRNVIRGLTTSCGCRTLEMSAEARRALRLERPGYTAAHGRVKQDRGSARTYTCPCGRPAQDWAYDHSDPNPLTEDYVMPSGRIGTLTYSTNIWRYTPMCHKCHFVMDWGRRMEQRSRSAQ